MFLEFGKQQHYFALPVACWDESLKLATNHLSFLIYLTKQWSSPQHLSQEVFASLLKDYIMIFVIYRSISSYHIKTSSTMRKGQKSLPGLWISATLLAQALPKTTMSRREFAPSRFAPWTEAQAASPAAIKPGTTVSGSSPLIVTTWRTKNTKGI